MNKKIEEAKKVLIETMNCYEEAIVFGSQSNTVIVGDQISVLATLGCIFLHLKESGISKEHIEGVLVKAYNYNPQNSKNKIGKELEQLSEIINNLKEFLDKK